MNGMNGIVKIENLKNLIIEIQGQSMHLDSDVANIYGVETKRINEAVKNNPDKFPQNYMFELSQDEFANLRSKISTSKFSKTRVAPKALEASSTPFPHRTSSPRLRGAIKIADELIAPAVAADEWDALAVSAYLVGTLPCWRKNSASNRT